MAAIIEIVANKELPCWMKQYSLFSSMIVLYLQRIFKIKLLNMVVIVTLLIGFQSMVYASYSS